MSYEKHTWQTGETITAEKLNNLENEANDRGYQYSYDLQTIVNQTIEVGSTPYSYYYGSINYSKLIDTPTIIVILGGQEYELSKHIVNGTNYYGGESKDDFSQNGFVIESSESDGNFYNTLYTQNKGTYNIIIKKNDININSDFSKAVEQVGSIFKNDIFVVEFFRSYDGSIYSTTEYQDLVIAFNNITDYKTIIGNLKIADFPHYTTVFLTGSKNNYGMMEFQFGFFENKDSQVNYTSIIFKAGGIESTTKQLSFTVEN